MNTKHTPGPWKVMADLILAGKSQFHDFRWIATENTVVDYSGFVLKSGELIAEMRDCVGTQQANARLIAAAPELLAALILADKILANAATLGEYQEFSRIGRAAIAKATGGAK